MSPPVSSWGEGWLLSPSHWCPRATVPVWWVCTDLGPHTRALKGGGGDLLPTADLGSWRGPWGARLSRQHAQSNPPHPLRSCCPSPASQFGLCLLRALPSLLFSATLGRCPRGGQIQPLLRPTEGFSCAHGTMGSTNSPHPSPPRYYLPPKCNVLSASPARALPGPQQAAPPPLSPLQCCCCSTKLPQPELSYTEHEQGAQEVRGLPSPPAEHPQPAPRMENGAAQGQRGPRRVSGERLDTG